MLGQSGTYAAGCGCRMGEGLLHERRRNGNVYIPDERNCRETAGMLKKQGEVQRVADRDGCASESVGNSNAGEVVT